MVLVPLMYGDWRTEEFYEPKIRELPAHFDQKDIGALVSDCTLEYSLHTEYAMGKRDFLNKSLPKYSCLVEAELEGVPELWKDKLWAKDFAEFLISEIGDNKPPKIIEIHPPFKSYCASIETFLARYQVFEGIIRTAFPSVQIIIENRNGSNYKRSGRSDDFLIRRIEDLSALGSLIHNFNLRIALDLPQLLSAHSVKLNKPVNKQGTGEWGMKRSELVRVFKGIGHLSPMIKCLHLWSRKKYTGRKSARAHHGNFDDWFNYDVPKHKRQILLNLQKALADGQERYLVAEVNSSQSDFESIMCDVVNAGFILK